MDSSYSSRFFWMFLLCCSGLTACGTKGPLYIPEQRYPQQALDQTHKNPLVQTHALLIAQKTKR